MTKYIIVIIKKLELNIQNTTIINMFQISPNYTIENITLKGLITERRITEGRKKIKVEIPVISRTN